MRCATVRVIAAAVPVGALALITAAPAAASVVVTTNPYLAGYVATLATTRTTYLTQVTSAFVVPALPCTARAPVTTMTLESRLLSRGSSPARLSYAVGCTNGRQTGGVSFDGQPVTFDGGAPAIVPGDILVMDLRDQNSDGTGLTADASVQWIGSDGQPKWLQTFRDDTVRPRGADSAGCVVVRSPLYPLPPVTRIRSTSDGCTVHLSGPPADDVAISLARRGAELRGGTISQISMADSTTGPLLTTTPPSRNGSVTFTKVRATDGS